MLCRRIRFWSFLFSARKMVKTYMGAAVELVVRTFESLQCFLLCKVLTKHPVRQEISTRSCAGSGNFVLDDRYLLPLMVSDRPREEETPRQILLGLFPCCISEGYPYSQAGRREIASLTDGLTFTSSAGSFSLCYVNCAAGFSKLEGHIGGMRMQQQGHYHLSE